LRFTRDEQKQLNSLVINEVTKEAGSKQAALKRTVKLAWRYFYKSNDRGAAIKLFNQAWLLDPDSDEVYYGFGVLMSLRGRRTMQLLSTAGSCFEIKF
jgi:hypothetical protein